MSKFFFLFSKNYKEQFEGFGIVFLEAMYRKNIVFASKHGGITDIVKNNFNGFLFDVNATYLDVIPLIEKAYTLKTNIRKTVLPYTWENCSKTIDGYFLNS